MANAQGFDWFQRTDCHHQDNLWLKWSPFSEWFLLLNAACTFWTQSNYDQCMRHFLSRIQYLNDSSEARNLYSWIIPVDIHGAGAWLNFTLQQFCIMPDWLWRLIFWCNDCYLSESAVKRCVEWFRGWASLGTSTLFFASGSMWAPVSVPDR